MKRRWGGRKKNISPNVSYALQITVGKKNTLKIHYIQYIYMKKQQANKIK